MLGNGCAWEPRRDADRRRVGGGDETTDDMAELLTVEAAPLSGAAA